MTFIGFSPGLSVTYPKPDVVTDLLGTAVQRLISAVWKHHSSKFQNRRCLHPQSSRQKLKGGQAA
jgi:hypothetical protein